MHGSPVCMVPLLGPQCSNKAPVGVHTQFKTQSFMLVNCREMKERAFQRSLQNRRSASQPSVQGAAR